MNLRQTFTYGRSKQHVLDIVHWVGNDATRFAELVALVLPNEKKISSLAAWPMSYVVEAHPNLATPHLEPLVHLMQQSPLHIGIRRDITRLLQFVELPEEMEGIVLDACFGYVQSPQEEAAVKASSITILEKLCTKYPELMPELQTVLTGVLDYESAAVLSRAKCVLKKWGKRKMI